jgi:hypothetical protein
MSNDFNDFTESVKAQARKLADFRCCYCHDMGDHVHHLVPKEEGGSGTLDNAILLCVQCHDRYGHRSDKQKQLEQARDAWYEIVKDRQRPEDSVLLERLQELATKRDLKEISFQLHGLFDKMMLSINAGSTSPQQAANVASIMVTSTSASASMSASPSIGVDAEVTRQCAECGKTFEPDGAEVFCPNCVSGLRSA